MGSARTKAVMNVKVSSAFSCSPINTIPIQRDPIPVARSLSTDTDRLQDVDDQGTLIMFDNFALNHILALFVAIVLTFGGMVLIFNGKSAIREMGFPPHLYESKEAQSIMTLGMGRTTVIGLALSTFYFQNKFIEVDTLLFILGAYLGCIDAYVCVKEGVPNKAIFRGTSGAVIAAFGWFGITAWA